MPRIEGFRVKNFRALKDLTLGRLWNGEGGVNKALTPVTAVIGKNGTGKSTLFDAFGFLADCMRAGVEEACDMRGRGGFSRLRTQGVDGSIEFEVYYREKPSDRPITYELSIALDSTGRPYVQRERLRQRRHGQQRGRPYSFLILENGEGVAWKGEQDGLDDNGKIDLTSLIRGASNEDIAESNVRERVELDDNRRLGIAALGVLRQHPRIAAFRKFIEGWYLSYFTPDAARSLPLAGPQRHLNVHGDNLGNVVQFMEREHPTEFRRILADISKKIPGLEKIATESTPDGRLLLKFNDCGFQDPFYVQQMSDGTLKVFAYLLLLADPTPPPLLCIEEPENGLYHKLLTVLAQEFRDYVGKGKAASQVFVTTHQPYFVDALSPEEVWVLEKGADGLAHVKRADSDPTVATRPSRHWPRRGCRWAGFGIATIWRGNKNAL
ncbi:MAG: AAA family ATPase [Synergistaceae bacterium]|jgi:predicted ATPase|nr:AAA family ATPase [Synergistaceae bacterium]